MEINATKTSWGCILKLKGNLNMYSSVDSMNNFEKHIATEKGGEIVLDMEELVYMDSSGVGVLIKLLNYCKDQGKKTSIANLKPAIEKIFTVSGLMPYFNVLSESEFQAKSSSA